MHGLRRRGVGVLDERLAPTTVVQATVHSGGSQDLAD
jgi:hypothetical protein